MHGALPLRPILSSLRRHKLTVSLLVFQVALTCAIVPNALFIVMQRVHRMHVHSGIAENRITLVHAQSIRKHENRQARMQSDLAALRRIPGAASTAAVGDGVPLDGGADTYDICPDQAAVERALAAHSLSAGGCVELQVYYGSPGFIGAWGLRVIAGRNFNRDEYVTGDVAVAVITRSLAKRFYPQGALGRIMYMGPKRPIRVVGVVNDVIGERSSGHISDYFVMFWPKLPNSSYATYVLNSRPQDRQRILGAAVKTLAKLDARRLMPKYRQQTYTAIRNDYFQSDVSMAGVLLAVSLGLLFMTALGVSGLASFWVQQRWRFIGFRRALGATRVHIICYFQLENILIVLTGILVGILAARGLSTLLAAHYEVAQLPFAYMAAGAAIVFAVSQLAVLGPALRAAAVPPLAATHSLL